MNHVRMAWLLALWLLAPCLAASQPPGSNTGPSVQPRPDSMYEDIEIMRRLLNTRLERLQTATATSGSPRYYPLVGPASMVPGASGMDSGFAPVAPQGARANLHTEGVYLKGQGAVFTLTLPPPQRDPRPEAATSTGKPLSDWERMRKEIRGEEVAVKDGDPKRKEPALADVILRVLADNGKHLQLPENESLTVVVTFRQVRQPFTDRWPRESHATRRRFRSPGSDESLWGRRHAR
jgi:hypothetical protein